MHFDFHERFDLNKPNKIVFECTPIRFCFVGPRGVGKSSLLASMYHQIHAKGISIEPSGYSTQHVLKEALKDMQEMINDTPMGHTVEESIGLQGSQEAAHYEFTGKQIVQDKDLIKRSDFKEFIFSFRFVDIFKHCGKELLTAWIIGDFPLVIHVCIPDFTQHFRLIARLDIFRL